MNLIYILYLLLGIIKINTPVRLNKKEETSFTETISNRIDAWANRHAILTLIVMVAFLIALFVWLIFALTGVSATESGMLRNFISRGV